MHKSSEPLGVPHDLRAKVIVLGNRLPALWENPATRREHRKALLRCLIEKVVMRRCARDKAEVRIVWRGGATTELGHPTCQCCGRPAASQGDGGTHMRIGAGWRLRR